MRQAIPPNGTVDPTSETFAHLRMARMDLARHFLLRHPELLNRWPWLRPLPLEPRPFLGYEILLSHSWLPGMVELSEPLGQALLELIAGDATPESSPEHRRLTEALRAIGWLEDAAVDLDALIVKAQDVYPAVQNPRELHDFLEVALARRPRTVVEIGTASGGTLYCLSQIADPSALLISIDFFGGAYGGGQTNVECRFFSTFGPRTQRFEFIRSRSFLQSTLASLRKILDGREIDLLFIDDRPADIQLPASVELEITHTEPGVRGDTASGGGEKPATVETGAEIKVPLFVNIGDRVKVQTETGDYMSRV